MSHCARDAIARRSRRSLAILSIAGAALASASASFANDVNGAWLSPVEDNWPLIPVHAALTPDGRVLTFGTNGSGLITGFFSYDVWDPEAGLSGGHVTLQNMTLTDIFCSNAVILPESGNILISGGDNWTGDSVNNFGNDNSNIYRPDDQTLTRSEDMWRPRWYASATPLMNGEVYIQGGKGGEDHPEVREVDGSYRLLGNVPTGIYWFYYPRNFLAPDGRVFGYDAHGQMYYVTTAGAGSIELVGSFSESYVGKRSAAAMFRPGKILQVSGMGKSAIVIDINGAQPVVTPTGSLSAKRQWGYATVLADGKVLVTGGSGADNQLVDVVYAAEIWNPATGTWKTGASASRPRLYHSTALLLPDASVLVGGGGITGENGVNNLHAEIYYPPYLFSASGGFAARPTIETAPDTLVAGENFSIVAGGSGSIDRVALVQAGSATHSTNLQQRFVELPFTVGSGTLFAQMPQQATVTPPGYWLLFVINDAGVPSKAKIVRVNPGEGGGDPDPPTDTVKPSRPSNPAISKVNGVPRLTWTASTDDVGVAGYAIHRSTNGTLGPEYALAASTNFNDSAAGVIEGTRYTYAIKAYDAAGNHSTASALRSITVTKSLPTKPGNFSLKLVNKDPQLSFAASTDNIGIAGYNVYRSTNGTMGPLYAQIPGAPWIDTNVQANKKYTYAVRARDLSGNLSNPTALKSIIAK